MTKLYYDVFCTDMGWMAALLSDKGLKYTSLSSSPQEALDKVRPRLEGAVADRGKLKGVKKALKAFLAAERASLDQIPLDLEDAPPFFRAAWEACCTIPLGETHSYAWLAAQADRPGAFRAAGQAMAKNPMPVVIPCHRVIGSHGGLHGYSGGLDLKAQLLKLEEGFRDRATDPLQ